MEINLLDNPWYIQNLHWKPVELTGSLYGIVAPAKEAQKPVGEWNTLDITLKGRQLTVVTNGFPTINAYLDAYKSLAERGFPGLKREKGYIGLQSHRSRVEFRNIEVREFPASEKGK
jgi:hypothetical protein